MKVICRRKLSDVRNLRKGKVTPLMLERSTSLRLTLQMLYLSLQTLMASSTSLNKP